MRKLINFEMYRNEKKGNCGWVDVLTFVNCKVLLKSMHLSTIKFIETVCKRSGSHISKLNIFWRPLHVRRATILSRLKTTIQKESVSGATSNQSQTCIW